MGVYDGLTSCFKPGRLSDLEYVDAVGANANDIDSALRKVDCHRPYAVIMARARVAARANSNVVHERGVGWGELNEEVVPKLGVLG
jgi:hypothetical protein